MSEELMSCPVCGGNVYRVNDASVYCANVDECRYACVSTTNHNTLARRARIGELVERIIAAVPKNCTLILSENVEGAFSCSVRGRGIRDRPGFHRRPRSTREGDRRGSVTTHTEICTVHVATLYKLRLEYETTWPNHCRACGGWGGASSYYDPSPAGVSLGAGMLEDWDSCSTCLDNNLCPRCKAPILEADDDDNGAQGCLNCGWTADDGGLPPWDPDCGCWYLEEREFHAHSNWYKETQMYSENPNPTGAAPAIEESEEGLQLWEIAKICHEANRNYCAAIGDDSQVPWEVAEQWQKDSAFDGVLYLLKNPDATPELCHDNWSKTKLRDGWNYGPVKNPDLKEHPCLVPYDRLPADQRAKDSLFHDICHALLSLLDELQRIAYNPGVPATQPTFTAERREEMRADVVRAAEEMAERHSGTPVKHDSDRDDTEPHI